MTDEVSASRPLSFELDKSPIRPGKDGSLIEAERKKQDQNELAATDYVETDGLKRIERASQQAACKRGDILDMFADEDEGARFAASGIQPSLLSQALTSSYGQALVDNWDDSEGYYRRFCLGSRMKICLD
jgi:hypothetical protein